MNKKDELEMLIRAMCGEKNVVEHMEAEGQRSVIKNTKMAKKMFPDKEEWEQLGFIFADISGDDVLYSAMLPQGWSIEAKGHPLWSEIIDENGMRRGSMFYKAVSYDRSAHMFLRCRYGVCSDYVGDDCSTIEVYFGNNEEKLFVAGYVHFVEDATREEIDLEYAEEDRLKSIAKQFGDENYPGWESVHAYWNVKKENCK